MSPKFAGAPDPIRLSDRLLVEWVANAGPRDTFPEPWCHAHSPRDSMISHLVELGVLDPPAPDTPVGQVAKDATAAARAWLERNPRPPAQPDPTSPAQARGKSYGR